MPDRTAPLFCVRNRTRGTLLGERIEVADTGMTRLVGLLGRRSLPPGCGLWIVPSQGVHTMGMRFAIDVLLLDGQDRVLRACPGMRPYRLSPVVLASRSVLELPAGVLAESRTAPGDELEFEPVTA
jgi:uncharacterized membrane protein (UPF0127 family)